MLSTTAHLYRHPDGTTHAGERCPNQRCFPPKQYDCILHSVHHPLTPDCMYAVAEWAIENDPDCGTSINILNIVEAPEYQKAYARQVKEHHPQ